MPSRRCEARPTSSLHGSTSWKTAFAQTGNSSGICRSSSWTRSGTRSKPIADARLQSVDFGHIPRPSMNIVLNILLVVYVLIALIMILVILMQRPKSEGLGAAFGGGVTENIFGAQTTNVLVKFTGWLAGIFFILTFVLSILYAHRSMGDSALRRELMKTETGAAGAPAAASSASPAQPGASVVPSGSPAA